MKSKEIAQLLEVLSPKEYAMKWDNVGFLVGNTKKEVHKILVGLDFDNALIDKAIEIEADMIVTHHPIIFSGLKSVTDETVDGNRVLRLLSNDICGYSMHTNFDVKGGMAALAAKMLGLQSEVPLEITKDNGIPEGIGRTGVPSEVITVGEWCEKVKEIFGIPNVILYGNKDAMVDKLSVCPGSGKEYVTTAYDSGSKLLITGDINHHAGVDAVDLGMNVIDAGHYGVEYIFVDYIVNYLTKVCREDVKVIGMDKRIPFTIV